jgi:hypothetical protein
MGQSEKDLVGVRERDRMIYMNRRILTFRFLSDTQTRMELSS